MRDVLSLLAAFTVAHVGFDHLELISLYHGSKTSDTELTYRLIQGMVDIKGVFVGSCLAAQRWDWCYLLRCHGFDVGGSVILMCGRSL
jgi:uncharacterized membrane protein YuzA (DUF378 family)